MASNSDDSQHWSEGHSYEHFGQKEPSDVESDDSIEEGQMVEQPKALAVPLQRRSVEVTVGPEPRMNLDRAYRCRVTNEPRMSEVFDEPPRDRLNLGGRESARQKLALMQGTVAESSVAVQAHLGLEVEDEEDAELDEIIVAKKGEVPDGGEGEAEESEEEEEEEASGQTDVELRHSRR